MSPTTARPAQAGLYAADLDLPVRLEKALALFLDRRRAAATAIDPAFGAAAGDLCDFVLGGGKRIRPTFAWWGWRGAGGDPEGLEVDAVLRAVAALELIQACALVHDDLMDASATRRGRPTVHVAFARRHAAAVAGAAEPARFGAAAAILLGDLALAWADDMLRACRSRRRRAGRAATAVGGDAHGGARRAVPRRARPGHRRRSAARAALQIDRYKTAAYTVERPLHLGAAIAGGGPGPGRRAYRRFGADIGVAFQLRDDLLGVFGDPAVTGKPAGDDLREGKRTLLLALAIERAEQRGSTAAVAEIEEAVGDPELDDARLDRVRDLLDDLGAVQAVEQRIAALTGSALDALGAGSVAEPAASRLADLAVAATRRHR